MHQAGGLPERASDDVDPSSQADASPRRARRFRGVAVRSARAARPASTLAPVAALGLVAALTLSACGLDSGPTASTPPDGSTPSATVSPPASESPQMSPGTEPGASVGPSAVPSGEPSAAPSDEPGPTPVAGGDDASGCSGNPGNQDFFRAVSEAVQWPVYCAVLPAGWSVESGTYSLGGSGQLEISYRGPAGYGFVLREGAFCASEDGCIPGGSDLGPALFGDREGTLIETGGDSWAIVVDPGAPAAWQALGSGMTEEELLRLAADLLRLGS